jgi:plastocyanin
MWKRLAVVAAAFALLASACGNDDNKKSASGDTSATNQSQGGAVAQTLPILVDNKTDQFNGAFLAYFPNAVTAHPGDTLDFLGKFTGEPHSVTFGTLVDAGVPKAEQAGQNADEPPELKKIPAMLPDGPGDANQTASQPCFLASGDPPADGPCPAMAQPAFDARYAMYSSGFIADGEHFRMKLADDLAPGTYRWMCTLHRAGMTGTLTVVGSSAAADTPEAVTQHGADRLAELAGKLKPIADQMQAITSPAKAQAGGGLPDVSGVVSEFGPKNISVPVGGSVTWDVQGPHTIAFDVPEDARTIIAKAPDGSVHLNPKAAAPAGGPGVPQGPPSDKPVAIDGGSWSGSGFRNTGVLIGAGPPGSLTYKLRFTRAGTYTYACLIHPDMQGTVKVG